ncbi:MAG: OmpA family protein [bacterium]|nr:OmpA family protein [bacterium]
MSQQLPPIIVKKVKKVVSSSAHGGSWKIAYADFMTTLMTFFLVMWLITMALSQGKRQDLVEYFKTYNIFLTTNAYKESTWIQKDSVAETPQKTIDFEGLKKELNATIETRLSDFKKNISINEEKTTGLRIDISDPEGNYIFLLGKPDLLPSGKKILKEMCNVLKEIDTKIAVEGHTDAYQYPTSTYTNWELSTERASSARKELELDGIGPERIAMVTGYADTKPIIIDDPYDGRNRRISLLILNPPTFGGDTTKTQEETPNESGKEKPKEASKESPKEAPKKHRK